MQAYTENFKRNMVRKLLVPGGPTQAALATKVGIAQTTLSRWVRQFGSVDDMPTKKAEPASRPRRPEDWNAQDRLRVVIETSKLSEEELGEFLRREGLHEETLEQWRAAALEGLTVASSPGSARGGDKKRIKQLERELARKEKALAEAAALLVLKKKVQAIWGDEDDDTNEGNDK
jgi:transposase